MLIGVPKEIKPQEYRVGLVPASVLELVTNGHQVIAETGLAAGIGIADEAYEAAGAVMVRSAKEVYERAELVVKVKEPQPQECLWLHQDQILFAFLHLAADAKQTHLLQASGCTAIAYETVTQDGGGLPLLSPMSQVAGRMAIQAGAHCLEKTQGGSGILLGGVPGVAPAKVVVIGAGVVGSHAIAMAVGMEAQVTVLVKSLTRLQQLDDQFGAKLNKIFSTTEAIEHYVAEADLVVGAVLVPGATAPKLITRPLLRKMRPGSVVVDVAIDQGGCIETSWPTTHEHPTYVEENIVHYCVANMPGAVPRTSTFALNNATLPFILNLANKGLNKALEEDPNFLQGLNIHRGKVTYEAVAKDLGLDYVLPQVALA